MKSIQDRHIENNYIKIWCQYNGIDKITEFCIELRSNDQLATEEAIQMLNEHSDEFTNEIKQFEMDCVKSYQTNETDREELIETVKRIELFLEKWTPYLIYLRI